MPIWKRDGVRKATEFTEDVNVVSVVQDPQSRADGKRRADKLPLELYTEAMRVTVGKE